MKKVKKKENLVHDRAYISVYYSFLIQYEKVVPDNVPPVEK